MDCSATAGWVTVIFTPLTGAAAVATAVIAYLASNSWRKGLEYQRYDECLAAVLYVQGAAYACAAAIENRKRPELDKQPWVEKNIWDTYAAAWKRQSRFRAAFSIASGYEPTKFSTDLLGKVDTILHGLRDQANSPAPDERIIKILLTNLDDIVEKVKEAIGGARRRRLFQG